RREIRALQQQLGITMVYVTHDQTEAMSMADQVILLNAGRIEQNDTPDQMYGLPSSRFSARFIGTPPMNILELDANTRHDIGLAGALLAHAPDHAHSVGIRPEHIELSSEGGIPATVESVEYFGADSILVCKVGSNPGVAVRRPGHLRVEQGEAIALQWLADKQHFFDP